jgi:hypothetical protein
MNTPTTTQEAKRWLALLPFAGAVPAIALPTIAAAGGKSRMFVFFGCWLLLLGLGLSIARKRLNAQMSPVVVFMLYFAGLAVAAMGVYLR